MPKPRHRPIAVSETAPPHHLMTDENLGRLGRANVSCVRDPRTWSIQHQRKIKVESRNPQQASGVRGVARCETSQYDSSCGQSGLAWCLCFTSLGACGLTSYCDSATSRWPILITYNDGVGLHKAGYYGYRSARPYSDERHVEYEWD